MAEETLEAPPETATPAEVAVPADELRQPLLDLLRGELGDDLVGFELAPGDDLCVRVNRSAWRRTAELCRDRLGLKYFCFLSGIDWQPNPDLLGEKAWEPPEAAVDTSAEATIEEAGVDPTVPASDAAISDAAGTDAGPNATEVEGATAPTATKGLPFPTGVAGGETRFQVFARLYNLNTKVGITLKADLDPDDPRVDSLVPLYRGADWHEREAWEMYGFGFDGHPRLRHLYLPGEFEGHPLRKDFPLLARLVKPWPGLVDVEPMPGEEVDPDGVAIPGDEA